MQTHGLENRQQIGKHDRCVHSENTLGIQRSLGSFLWVFKKIQARQIAFYLMVFGHVPPRLTVQPDRSMRGLFSATRLQECLFHELFPCSPAPTDSPSALSDAERINLSGVINPSNSEPKNAQKVFAKARKIA